MTGAPRGRWSGAFGAAADGTCWGQARPLMLIQEAKEARRSRYGFGSPYRSPDNSFTMPWTRSQVQVGVRVASGAGVATAAWGPSTWRTGRSPAEQPSPSPDRQRGSRHMGPHAAVPERS